MRNLSPTSPNLSRRRMPGAPSSGWAEPLFLLLTGQQWLIALAVGLALALAGWPLYHHTSPWVAAALVLVGVTLVHLQCASRFIVPFPHIFLLIAALQYVLAAAASAYWPTDAPLYVIGRELPIYLPFATLVLLACAAGWGLGLIKLRLPVRRLTSPPTPRLLFALDALLILGFLGMLAAKFAQETNFAFFFILIANLRYVGVFGRMVLRAPGWGWRLAFVAIAQLLISTDKGTFHGMILFGFWAFAIWAFVFGVSWRAMIIASLVGLLLLPALQASKWELRGQTWLGDEVGRTTFSKLEKTTLWSSYMLESIRKTLTLDLDRVFLGETCARYNQGWIVNRVMQHVPAVVPYARGETIRDTFISAMVPRVFSPNKVITGGVLNMERFAGVELEEGTSMNLGYAGEMYANFGYWGGILGCGLYCLGFSLLFRAVCHRAFVSPLWWAVLAYVCFVAVKAEDDIVGVVNWSAKASVVMMMVCLAFPAFRQALFPNKTVRRRRRSTRAPAPNNLSQP